MEARSFATPPTFWATSRAVVAASPRVSAIPPRSGSVSVPEVELVGSGLVVPVVVVLGAVPLEAPAATLDTASLTQLDTTAKTMRATSAPTSTSVIRLRLGPR